MALEPTPSFVFYDPSGRRWRRFRRGVQTFALFLILLLFAVIMVAVTAPQLPTLGLPEVQHLPAFSDVRAIIRGEAAGKNVPFRRPSRDVKYVKSASPVIHPRPAAKASGGKPIVFGFYVNWDPASIVSLRLNLSHLTHLVPEWLTLQDAKGNLSDEADSTVIEIARQANLPILAMVTNYRDGWQANDVHVILSDAKRRTDLIEAILSNLKEHKFAGVNIDFESLGRADSAPLVRFMGELKAQLQPQGYLVTQSVPVDDEAYDLKALAQKSDFIVPMLYDEHYQSSQPGPVASQDWFDNELERVAKLVPPEKTVIGFGAYGYDWIIGKSGSAETVFADVVAAAVQNKQKIAWDADAMNPVLRYTQNGDQHEVWFLDAVTGFNQVTSIESAGFRGVALWRLGAEEPGLWTVLKPETWPDPGKFEPVQLWPLTAKRSVGPAYGTGEILRIAETPHDGSRNVWRHREDDDLSEDYQALPTYYVVERTGEHLPKTVSLTFDDGPAAGYTTQILDILKREGVPATFFVIGINAENYRSILQREYAEGHEIGNHTYSHPNIAATSEERTMFELIATQRIIENTLGVSTILFRPPYNADSEPQTPDEIVPILRAQKANYVTIGESIDPRDWQPGITAAGIVKEVESELSNGHIILLHDGGGDRSATVAAVPQIIHDLKQKGYRFVPLRDLAGRTKAQLMPVPPPSEMRRAQIEGEAFSFKSDFTKVIGILFLTAIYLTLFRSLAYGFLALLQKFEARKRRFDPSFRPPVSVLVAAYNEETVIRRTVESILSNGYEDIEIIVFDDGSKDSTYSVLQSAFGHNPKVQIFTQPNAGKSAALNGAISHASNEILVAVDADTIFRKGTIETLARHFCDPKVGAVSGNARVGNRNSWITKFQSIEYIYGFNLDRRALDYLNAITVVPGAVGAWRKSLILAAGGFGHDTLAEDTDLTLAIRRNGYKIRYEEAGIAYTEAPEDTRSLSKQRFRWAFGTLQAAWKHRDAMFVPRYGSLGFVALPSIWLFQVMLSALSPFAEIAMFISLFAGNGAVVLLYYLAFFLLELLTGLLAYALEGEKPWDLWLLFFQRIYYRQLMHYVLFKSLIYAMRGRLVGWGKLERRASVTSEAAP